VSKDIAVGCIREFGDVTCAGPFGPQNEREYKYERALVLTFATEHALRKAIHEGVVKFGPFGESPSNDGAQK